MPGGSPGGGGGFPGGMPGGYGGRPGGGGGPPAAAAEPAGLVGGRHLDARLLEKPRLYDGEPSKWREWRLRFEAFLDATDERFGHALDEATRVAGVIQEAAVPLAYTALGHFLFSMLLGVLAGALLEIVAATVHHNGWEAWRCVVNEMEPRAAGQRLTILESLIDPDLGDAVGASC